MSLVKKVSRRKILSAGAVVVGASALIQPNGGLIPSAFAQGKEGENKDKKKKKEKKKIG